MMRLLLLLVLAGIAPFAVAQEETCNPAGNQAQMNRCAFDELAAADAGLNAVYRQVLKQLQGQPLAIDRLRNAQRLWIQLRDADIAARYPVKAGEDPAILYGSIYPLVRAQMQAALTRQRTQWLRATFIDRAEGDL